MNSYKNKYQKYKNKYINLKKKIYQSGGTGINNISNIINIINTDNICPTNDTIENNYEKIKNYLFSNTDKQLDDELNIIKNLCSKNCSNGPTIYSNWILNNKLLMGAIPKDCDDMNKLIDDGKINLFISLREDDEIYQNCNNNTTIKPIFWRFRIPDFNTRDVEDVKTLVDNIINYLLTRNEKIMIHCLGGHGRTGTIICCIIAVLLFLNKNDNINLVNSNDNINNIINSKLIKIKKITNFKDTEKEILELSEKIFKYSQFYVMLSLSTFRITDSLLDNFKLPEKIKVPEISSQDLLVMNVIKLYIENYLRNGFINTTLSKINEDKCGKKENYINEEGKPIWKCANICNCPKCNN